MSRSKKCKCPFCGSRDWRVLNGVYLSWPDMGHCIRCDKCSALGSDYKTEKWAIKNWEKVSKAVWGEGK